VRILDKITERSFFKRLKESKHFLLLLLFFAVLPLLVSSAIIYFCQSNQRLFVDANLRTMVGFYLISILTMAFALTPTTFIASISGYFFSWYGLAGILAAYPLAAVLGLTIGKAANNLVLSDSFYQNKETQLFLEKIRQDEFIMIILARLSPVLPFAMINVALSVLKLNRITYIAATMIGMFPRTFMFFMAGKDAREIWAFAQNPTFDGFYRLLPLLLILVSTIGLLWALKRAFRRMKGKGSDA